MRFLMYTEIFPSRRAGGLRQTGVGRYCADLAWGLGSAGHEVSVLTNDEIGDPASPSPEPFRVEVLGPVPSGGAAVRARAAQVRDRVLALRPEYLLVGDPAAHAVLWTAAGSLPTVVCPVFYGTELVAWRHASTGLSPRGFLRRQRLRRYLQGSVPICISRFTAGLLRTLAPEAPRECLVTPCVSSVFLSRAMDPEFAGRLRRRLAAGGTQPLILTTVARISERKNQLRVLEALAQLRPSGLPWHYLILGNVDAAEHEGYYRRLRDFAGAHDLADRVTFVHETTDEEKVDYLDASDAGAMLSRTVGVSVEGFGISVVEAAARGKPVVVSNQGGMPETILEGVTGFAIDPDDTGGVARALVRLGDEGLRHDMGQQGRRWTLDRFTPTATAATLAAQLQERREARPVPQGGDPDPDHGPRRPGVLTA